MPERTIEDRLREEYFRLLPQLTKASEQLEAQIKYHCLPITRDLQRYERLVVTSRIKSCDSAVDALRRRQEGRVFDREKQDAYSLLDLPDLVGIRILALPRKRLADTDAELRQLFPSWISDPVQQEGRILAHKYHGPSPLNSNLQCEYQIVSMLTGLFWEVEHSALYKAAPELKGIRKELRMEEATLKVYTPLRLFEEEFDRLLIQAEK